MLLGAPGLTTRSKDATFLGRNDGSVRCEAPSPGVVAGSVLRRVLASPWASGWPVSWTWLTWMLGFRSREIWVSSAGRLRFNQVSHESNFSTKPSRKPLVPAAQCPDIQFFRCVSAWVGK